MISPTMLSESTATRSSVSPVEVWPELEPVSPAGGREGSPALGDGEPAPAAGAGATGSWACDRTDFLGPFINGQPLSQGFDAGPNGSSAPFAHAHECARQRRDVSERHTVLKRQCAHLLSSSADLRQECTGYVQPKGRLLPSACFSRPFGTGGSGGSGSVVPPLPSSPFKK